jgi:hypothetical protein
LDPGPALGLPGPFQLPQKLADFWVCGTWPFGLPDGIFKRPKFWLNFGFVGFLFSKSWQNSGFREFEI